MYHFTGYDKLKADKDFIYICIGKQSHSETWCLNWFRLLKVNKLDIQKLFFMINTLGSPYRAEMARIDLNTAR